MKVLANENMIPADIWRQIASHLTNLGSYVRLAYTCRSARSALTNRYIHLALEGTIYEVDDLMQRGFRSSYVNITNDETYIYKGTDKRKRQIFYCEDDEKNREDLSRIGRNIAKMLANTPESREKCVKLWHPIILYSMLDELTALGVSIIHKLKLMTEIQPYYSSYPYSLRKYDFHIHKLSIVYDFHEGINRDDITHDDEDDIIVRDIAARIDALKIADGNVYKCDVQTLTVRGKSSIYCNNIKCKVLYLKPYLSDDDECSIELDGRPNPNIIDVYLNDSAIKADENEGMDYSYYFPNADIHCE